MFRGTGNKKLCEDILHEVAQRHHIAMIELSVMPDHIHTVVQLPPTMSVSQALHLLKGASSYELSRFIAGSSHDGVIILETIKIEKQQ